jgi:hypothetical protein
MENLLFLNKVKLHEINTYSKALDKSGILLFIPEAFCWKETFFYISKYRSAPNVKMFFPLHL